MFWNRIGFSGTVGIFSIISVGLASFGFSQQESVTPVGLLYEFKTLPGSHISTNQIGSAVLIQSDSKNAYIISNSHVFYNELTKDSEIRVSFVAPFNPIKNVSYKLISIAHRIPNSDDPDWAGLVNMTLGDLRSGKTVPFDLIQGDIAIAKLEGIPPGVAAKVIGPKVDSNSRVAIGWGEKEDARLEVRVDDVHDCDGVRYLRGYRSINGVNTYVDSSSGMSGGFVGEVSGQLFSLEGLIVGSHDYLNEKPSILMVRLDRGNQDWIRRAIRAIESKSRRFIYVQ